MWIARKHGLDPKLFVEVAYQESSFNRFATSPAGAKGLMQFIPGTSARYGLTDPYDPEQAIDAGCRYLSYPLELFNGRLDLALAGYITGEHAVIKYGYRVPPYAETQNYVRSIIAAYRRAQALAAGNYQTAQTVRERKPRTKAELKQSVAEINEQLSTTLRCSSIDVHAGSR